MKHPSLLPGAAIRLPFLAALLCAATLRAADEPLPVDCPGFGRTAPIINGPGGWPALEPVLVVLGTSRLVKDNRGSPSLHRIEIEKVLFGHYEGKEVDYTNLWSWEGRNIYFLSPAPYKGPAPYEWWDMMDPGELKTAQELCDNRFDGLVLGANAIFVGTEQPPHKEGDGPAASSFPKGTTVRIIGGGSFWEDYAHEVKVVRQLSGKPLKAGDSITAIIDGFIRYSGGAEEPFHPEERIYFASGPMKDQVDGRDAYRVTPLPIEMEAQVKAALARRDSYPVSTEKSDNSTVTYREILLRGTMDDALALLDSESMAAIDLAQKYFLFHADDARKALTAKITATMSTPGPAAGKEFRTQLRFIDALDTLELKHPTGAIPALAEQLVAKLEKETPAPPMPERDESKLMTYTYPGSPKVRMAEETTTDINHTLAWLILKMDESDVALRWGDRLHALQPRLTGYWRQEVDLAVNVARIDQNLSMNALLARMDGVQPVRFAPPFEYMGGVGAVAVSPDGKYLATCSYSGGPWIAIRDTATWKTVARIPQQGGQPVFSPDSQFLYTPGPVTGAITRYECGTGAVNKSYTYKGGWAGLIGLSRDGAVMVTHDMNAMDAPALVWDTASGRIIRTVGLPRFCDAIALSPDGKSIAHVLDSPYIKGSDFESTPECTILIEPVDGKSPGTKIHCGYYAHYIDFTPDGRFLLCSGGRTELRDLRKGGKVAASAAGMGGKAVISPGGKYLAFTNGTVLKFPSLEKAWSFTHERDRGPRDVAFSADDKTLFIADDEGNPRIFRTDTFEETLPYAGHAGYTRDIFYSPDGKRIATFGGDGSICHWDAATLAPLDRTKAPAGFELLGIEPQGGYAFYSAIRFSEEISDQKPRATLVVDTATGKTVCSAEMTVSRNDQHYWLGGGQLLVIADYNYTEHITLVDYLNGKVLARVIDPMYIDRGPFFLSRDRRSLLAQGRTEHGNAARIDLAPATSSGTMPESRTDVNATPDGDNFTADGVTYETLVPAPARESEKWKLPELRGVSGGVYSIPGGHLIARVVEDSNETSSNDPHRHKPRPLMLVFYDLPTMKPLYAIHPTAGISTAAFNADQTRLTIAGEDGSLETWPLPK